MLKRIWKYGTRLRATVLTVFDGTVPAYALKDENDEGHILYNIRHAIQPNIGDRVVMEFTKGGANGGYWRIVSFDETAQPRTFFRVNHLTTQQGLWYGFDGQFTGLIHDRFAFCQNRDLAMDFDPEIVGYMSAVETMEQLFAWFSREDIQRLQDFSFYIHEYRSSDFKWYERFQHHVIHQPTAEVVRVMRLEGD